jgi:hypothetical protein
MSNDQGWEQEPDPYRDSFDQQRDTFDQQNDDRYRAPKPGMSTGMKVLITLLIFFGGGMLLCCGGVTYFTYIMFPKTVDDPEGVKAIGNRIVDIDVPEGLEPQSALEIDNFLFAMRAGTYSSKDGKKRLFLWGTSFKVGAPQAGQEAEFREAVEKESRQRPVKVTDVVTKKIKVKGAEQEFTFSKAEGTDGQKFRQVSGSFPGKTGLAALSYQAEEDAYNEDEVIKMIESIK